MLDEASRGSTAVPIGILDLAADRAERFALPGHLLGCQVPGWMAGHPSRSEIGALVADVAAHARQPKAICTPNHRRLVWTAGVALARTITCGVAVQTAGTGEHLAKLGE